MARRSRSQRPPKTPHAEDSGPAVPAVAKSAGHVAEQARETSAAPPIDELAALDAGWDDLPG